MPLEAVSVSGATISLGDVSIAVGLLCFFVAYLIFSYIVGLVVAAQQQAILDLQEFSAAQAGGELPRLTEPETDHSKGAHGYRWLAGLQFVVDGLLPVLFALAVILFCVQDLLMFVEHLWSVVDSEIASP